MISSGLCKPSWACPSVACALSTDRCSLQNRCCTHERSSESTRLRGISLVHLKMPISRVTPNASTQCFCLSRVIYSGKFWAMDAGSICTMHTLQCHCALSPECLLEYVRLSCHCALVSGSMVASECNSQHPSPMRARLALLPQKLGTPLDQASAAACNFRPANLQILQGPFL
jgi:hypothetical protein